MSAADGQRARVPFDTDAAQGGYPHPYLRDAISRTHIRGTFVRFACLFLQSTRRGEYQSKRERMNHRARFESDLFDGAQRSRPHVRVINLRGLFAPRFPRDVFIFTRIDLSPLRSLLL